MYSDNGTNFVGADNAFNNINWDVMQRITSIKRVEWILNPLQLIYKQKLMDQLRLKFRKGYLSQLVGISGKEELRNLKIGDVVFIGDDSYKRLDWPLG